MICQNLKYYKNMYWNVKYYTEDDINIMINNENRCIIVSNKNVYDVTNFVDEHPGGSNCLWKKCKERADCSIDFNFHGKKGQKLWGKFKIGQLVK